MEAYHPPALADRSPSVATAILVLFALALLVFPLRVYVRVTNNSWGHDDTLMSIATVPFLGLTIGCLGGAFHGIGVHKTRLSDDQTTTALKWFFLFEIFYCITIIMIKASIAFMLVRVAGPMTRYRWSLYICTALFTAMNIISLFYIIFQCQPVSFAWDTSTPGGHCNPSKILADIYYADTAVNIITDWFCALLPFALLWNVQLNRNSKISVGFLLSLGVLASISACIRLKYTVNLNNSTDYLYSVSDIVIWGYAENGVGLIVGCASTLRPLLRSVFKLGSSNGVSGGISEQPGRQRSGALEFDTFTGASAGQHTTSINTKTMGKRRTSIAWDSGSESEERLVKGKNDGIQVSTVLQQRRD